MQYVKLTARPDTWFKAGTEVYQYDCDPRVSPVRVTLDEWNNCYVDGRPFVICVRGLRVVEEGYEAALWPVGTERWDGEACGMDEFDVEIVEEPR